MTLATTTPPLDVPKPEQDDLRLWSVTTIIGVLDKPALLYWASEQAALAAVAQADYLPQRIEAEGRAGVVKSLRDARFQKPKDGRTAADLGTAVHAAIEEYAITGKLPSVDAEVQPYLDSFDVWAQRFQPAYDAAEFTVYSPTYGYAGTCDGVFTVDGVRFIVDYKSSAKSFDARGNPATVYPEIALQLAGYRYAEFAAAWRPRRYEQFRRRYYLLGPGEIASQVPVPTVDAGLGVKITPAHTTAYPVRCDEAVHTAFLYVLEAARWQFEMSKGVIGEALVSDGPGED